MTGAMTIFRRILTAPLIGLLVAALGSAGCTSHATTSRSGSGTSGGDRSTSPATERTDSAKTSDVQDIDPDKLPPDVKRSKLREHIWFETQGDARRVRIEAKVCRPDYGLEFLLTRPNKGYESLLATEADARDIHLALVAAKATPGHPARFEENGVKPPTGTPIRISLEYRDKGKLIRVPAQKWIRNAQTKKEDNPQWVFAGSRFLPDPNDTTQDRYAASDDGAYICVINLPTAMIDLTANSPRGLENRAYEPFTERIPPADTPVVVILEPIVAKVKDDTEKK